MYCRIKSIQGLTLYSQFRSGQIYFVKLIAGMTQFLEFFIIAFMWSLCDNVINDRYICLLATHVPCNWMATEVRKIITVRAVCEQFHSFRNKTGVWFLDSLTASIDCGLHKVVETFDRSVLNKSIIFVHTSPSCNWNCSNGVMIVPLDCSKLELNSRRDWDINPSSQHTFALMVQYLVYKQL